MTKKNPLLIALLLVALVCASGAFNLNKPTPTNAWRTFPIQHEGRTLPLDSVARIMLLSIHGKENLNGTPAIKWLSQTFLNPNNSYTTPTLHIPSRQTATALGLPRSKSQRYTFTHIAAALLTSEDLLTTIRNTPPQNRTPLQNQIIAVTIKHTLWFNLSRSLAPFKSTPSPLDSRATTLKTIPLKNGDWLSPQEMTNLRIPMPKTLQTAWQKTAAQPTHAHITALKKTTLNAAPNATPWRLKLEVFYNHINPFKLSLMGYLVAATLSILSLTGGLKKCTAPAHIALLTGLSFHTLGLALRIAIMQRAPVATLYESIVFTALAAALALYLFYQRRHLLTGILLASGIGATLHFIALRYSIDGHNMGVLVAVLNTNFWLTTHVIAMVLGYAFCLVAAAQAHVYLIRIVYRHYSQKLSLRPEPIYWDEIFPFLQTVKRSVRQRYMSITQAEKRENFAQEDELWMRAMLGMALVALAFTTLGTILGGIWADQSWGRFWGWDPKENGALLIVLWLIFVTHGRFKVFAPHTFAALLAGTTIVIALAWFGVNLLGVGLHSYGFTNSGALALTLFCSLNALLIIALWSVAHIKARRV